MVKITQKTGLIERFGVDYKGSNPVIASFKLLLIDDNRLFYIGRENIDHVGSEISLFTSGDKVKVEGYDDEKGNFFVCKIINKTLSERLNKSVEFTGYERRQINNLVTESSE